MSTKHVVMLCCVQVFIQVVLLMSVFEKKIELFKVVKCKWGSRGAANSTTGSQPSPSGGSQR